MPKLLIKAATVIVGEDSPSAQENTDVLIDGGQIAAVERGIQAPDAELIDAQGKLVFAGLVDTHRHIWQRQACPEHQ